MFDIENITSKKRDFTINMIFSTFDWSKGELPLIVDIFRR